ncbi:hypothetical protein [Thermodesulforhabdus norvegica]|uniref:TubC N-terminal docking domain-related protein n=1 Tax=Thermodesulforhabdus norvegica TaxID=39841 RepID=UPI000B816833
MFKESALRKFLNQGLRVWLDGQKLKYSAPKSTADEAVNFLRRHKARIIALIQNYHEKKRNPK